MLPAGGLGVLCPSFKIIPQDWGIRGLIPTILVVSVTDNYPVLHVGLLQEIHVTSISRMGVSYGKIG
jgi:hypothetical protein